MAIPLKSPLFFLLLVITLFSFTEAARPFNILKAGVHPKKKNLEFFDGLTLGAIKESGPSPGEGHSFTNAKTIDDKKFTNVQFLGGVKNAGPSPGDGNKFTNGKTLGGNKTSGPSPPGAGNNFTNGGIKTSGPSPPGAGNKFTNGKTLGGNKTSGPSPPGDGNKYTNGKTLGGIKTSGPSPPGDGHYWFPYFTTLGGVKNSGSNPGEGHKSTNTQTLEEIRKKHSGPAAMVGRESFKSASTSEVEIQA
ncbi:translation initiation factor IF-2-like [Telopea speciosissima]|uniref:translation initiation factor IF-2-like n=1 Tax=Telopea speciosissima TaxID=54955 RepID=UPI001CC7E764|nr:translation initiation factor IF-2-like [Telopea speciosissima]